MRLLVEDGCTAGASRFEMVVGDVVSGFTSRAKEFSNLLNPCYPNIGVEFVGCRIPSDGFGLAEPPVCRGANGPFGGCSQVSHKF